MSEYMKWSAAMDILKLAKDAGMLVVLDGRIGKEEYRSVRGSEQAFRRFADALCELAGHEVLSESTRSKRSICRSIEIPGRCSFRRVDR
jgi:hypothetical protein